MEYMGFSNGRSADNANPYGMERPITRMYAVDNNPLERPAPEQESTGPEFVDPDPTRAIPRVMPRLEADKKYVDSVLKGMPERRAAVVRDIAKRGYGGRSHG